MEEYCCDYMEEMIKEESVVFATINDSGRTTYEIGSDDYYFEIRFCPWCGTELN